MTKDIKVRDLAKDISKRICLRSFKPRLQNISFCGERMIHIIKNTVGCLPVDRIIGPLRQRKPREENNAGWFGECSGSRKLSGWC